MERPLVFFVVVGVAIVLFLNYSGSSFFSGGPLATGPGGGIGVEPASSRSLGSSGAEVVRTPAPEPGKSPFANEVRISAVYPDAVELKEEYIVLRRSGSALFDRNDRSSINLDGWTIENGNGNRIVIPKALLIPGAHMPEAPIMLGDGEEIIIATAASTFGASFRENICTGYFEEFHEFRPPLSYRCPSYSSDELLKSGLNSACIDVISATPRCRQVRIGFEEQGAGNECVDFVQSHVNYASCLRENKDKQNFSVGAWRVFLNRRVSLWDPLHDIVVLRDKNSLIVDEYTY